MALIGEQDGGRKVIQFGQGIGAWWRHLTEVCDISQCARAYQA